MWLFSGLMYFIFIVMGVTTGLTPIFSRQATPFGVAVANKHEYIEERKKRYGIWTILISGLLGLPLLIFPFIENPETEMISAMYLTGSMLLYMIFAFGLYLKYRSDILRWKGTLPKSEQQQSKRVVIDMNYHQNIKAKSHLTFFIWQFVIILIPVLIAFAFYDRIPEQIPVNWDSQFEVNRTIVKSIWAVLALPGIQLFMIPVLNYSNHALVHSKQRLSPLDPVSASESSRKFREAWSNYTFAITIATQLLISFLFLYSLFSQGRWGWLMFVIIAVYLVLTIGSTLYLTFKYGQAGEKLLDEKEQYYIDPDEEENWKYGVFYFNKEDPSIFVEKRFGIGTTINFARWQAWVLILGLILFTVLTITWSAWLT